MLDVRGDPAWVHMTDFARDGLRARHERGDPGRDRQATHLVRDAQRARHERGDPSALAVEHITPAPAVHAAPAPAIKTHIVQL